MKTYSLASDDVLIAIQLVRDRYYSPDLDDVTIAALFVYDMEASEPVLTHGGYPAQAVCRITPTRDRALGVADVVLLIDRSNWLTLTRGQREALMDHELHHIERVVDEETELPKTDAVDRPKLAIRKHDHQVGFFTTVAARNGADSAEVRQIKYLLQDASQLSFEFSPASRAA